MELKKLQTMYNNTIDSTLLELNNEIKQICEKYTISYNSGMGLCWFTLHIDYLNVLKDIDISKNGLYIVINYKRIINDYLEDEEITKEQAEEVKQIYDNLCLELKLFIENCITLQESLNLPYLLSWCTEYKNFTFKQIMNSKQMEETIKNIIPTLTINKYDIIRIEGYNIYINKEDDNHIVIIPYLDNKGNFTKNAGYTLDRSKKIIKSIDKIN